MLAPVILFVYNRLDYVKKAVESLSKNAEAKDSALYIFSDAAKNPSAEEKVRSVREYIDMIEKGDLFKEVFVTKAKENKGLARSIIDGVSSVMEKHGKAIIIEDDMVLAPDFLDYMNRGLEFYKDDKNVWAVSGFSRKMQFPSHYKHDVFALERISSYTWASWADRWNKIKWDISGYYPNFFTNIKKRKKFDLCGEDRSLMLDAQMVGKVNSWAIRFEYSMVENGGYSVLPCVSRAFCNGNDGSGTHSQKETHAFDANLSDGKHKAVFEKVEQDEQIRKEFVKPYRRNLKRKIFRNADFILAYYRGQR